MTESDRDQAVCPDCGSTANGRWCQGCGLNLGRQASLPTREEFEAKQREATWLNDQEEKRKAARQQKHARHQEDFQRRQLAKTGAAKARRQKRATSQQRRAARLARLRGSKLAVLGTGVFLAAVAGTAAWLIPSIDVPFVAEDDVPVLGDGSGADAQSDAGNSTDASDGTTLDERNAESVSNCEDITITPRTDNVIANLEVEGIRCGEASEILYSWGTSGYPGDAPAGFQCVAADRPLEVMSQSTGLRCTRGDEVLEFGGG